MSNGAEVSAQTRVLVRRVMSTSETQGFTTAFGKPPGHNRYDRPTTTPNFNLPRWTNRTLVPPVLHFGERRPAPGSNMNLKLTIPIALAAVVIPIGIAVCSNWSNLQPHLVSDAKSSLGELYYFSDRRG